MSAQPEAELTGNVMFYQQPEPLSLERHRLLGAKRVDKPFQFLGASHVVPITVNEFGVAAGSYPVIFAGEKKTPLAVMGIRGGENVFVDRAGDLDPEVYLPAFVRRYPFVFASDGTNDRLLVCIDRAAPMIGENPEVPFFNGDEPSQYTQDAIEFCKEFERHRLGTEAFVQAIDGLGLFEEKDITLSQNLPDGKQEQARIADYFAISEEKLNALPADKVQILREQGMFGPIYAHLISLLAWPKIINRGLTLASAEMQAQARANTPFGVNGHEPAKAVGRTGAGLYVSAMRLLASACAALGLLALATPSLAAPFRTDNVEGELVSSRAVVRPGETFTVALHEKIRSGWHTYWRNAGDSGEPTTIKWALPAGFTAAPNEWPAPTIERAGPITTYVYKNEVFLPMQITAPANLKPGPVDLNAHVRWLVCSDICIPEEGDVSLQIKAGAAGKDDPQWAGKLKAVSDGLPKPEGVTASLAKAGDAYQLTLAGGPIAKASAVTFLPYGNDKIDHAAEQPFKRQGDGGTLTLTPSIANGLAEGPLEGILLYDVSEGGQSVSKAVEISTGGSPVATSAAPVAAAAETPTSTIGIMAALGLAFLGGLVLNVMPCVFPVLSLKALSLARGGEQAEATRHGLFFVGGVMATFLALAGALIGLQAAGSSIGWGFQLQEPLVVGALGLLFFVIGLNLLGAFEFGGALQNVGSGLASRGGDMGAFFTGALAVVAATPCTAPFMGAALGFAATQPPLQSLLVFAVLGLGFAAPFAALSFFPVLRSWLPKPGAWMNQFKEFLAFPMFAAAAWLVWVLVRLTGADGVVAALAAFIAVGFSVWAWRAFTKMPPRVIATVLALALLVFAASGLHAQSAEASGASSNLPLHGEAWTPAREAALRGEGRAVLVNFTAAWCVTCQVNERVAFRSQEVAKAFADGNAAYLEADWTAQDAVIAKTLAAHGRAGVPLYLFYPAKDGAPEILPQLLTPGMVVDAVKRATAKS